MPRVKFIVDDPPTSEAFASVLALYTLVKGYGLHEFSVVVPRRGIVQPIGPVERLI